ncbi:MAG: hypothetical protein HZA03_07175 [Nitrospinae bacterium]|nr:hypothetical protein [Nitrospinota bacterium]
MSKLFAAFAFALLVLPGFAWAEESCHRGQAGKAEVETIDANERHAGHAHSAAGGIEEIPQTAPVSSADGHNMNGDCPHNSGFGQTYSSRLALMKCGTGGCCIKTEIPLADGGFSPKAAPEMAVDASQGLNTLSSKELAAPYLLEKLSNLYPPVPRPPAA